MTIGAEIRKENVTPSGTPALTKPMNNGTAEQEQNGVTMPSEAASTLPIAFAFSGKQCPSFFRREEAAHDAHAEHDQGEQHQYLRCVVSEEADRLAEMAIRIDGVDATIQSAEWNELAVYEAPHN